MEHDKTPDLLVDHDEPPACGCALNAAPSRTARTLTQLHDLKADPCWNDWKWHMRNRIRTVQELLELFPNLAGQPQIQDVITRYPLAITPYYASLIRRADLTDPVFQMSVPQMDELYDPPFLQADPLQEEKDMPVPGLIHRYPDRALIMATTMCSMYCRHCTRKRVAGTEERAISAAHLRQITDYLTAHPRIADVILSGGDPFTLPLDVLEGIISAVRKVASVQIIRIGTRTPVVLPQRITAELTAMLKRYHPLWVNTHFNHPVELTPEATLACERLVDAGIPMGNQTVLLRGVNDSPTILEELFRGLVRARVRPYYLFQCDLVRGIEHFRTPIKRGVEIMEYLRGRLSGLAIPTFVVDTPQGGGKVPLLPDYVVSSCPTHTILRNGDGMMIRYPEPAADTSADL